MTVHNNVMLILMTFLAGSMSLKEDCNNYYGNCNPGPNCDNWDPIINKHRCYSCHDGGFWPLDFECDGKIDCRNERDEKNCKPKDLQSKVAKKRVKRRGTRCLFEGETCLWDFQCCTNRCSTFGGLLDIGVCTWFGGFACLKNNELCAANFQCCSKFCWQTKRAQWGMCFNRDEIIEKYGCDYINM